MAFSPGVDKQMAVEVNSQGVEQFTGQMMDAESSLVNFRNAVGAAGAALAALGAAGISRSVTAFASFDEAMTESLAIMGDVDDAMRETMQDTARDVAKTTQFSAEQAAESYFFLASAGLEAAESVEVLDDMAQFAQAGQFDMARATDILTDSASALGKEVADYNDVADTFVKANQLANTSVEQVGEAMTAKAGAAMRQFNIDLDDGVAALAAYADQGIKGSRAGEVFNRTLLTLAEGANENREAFEELGVEVFDSEGEMRDFSDVIGELDGALGDMSTEQQNLALQQMGFTRRTREGVVALLGQSDALGEYRSELDDAGGAAGEVAENQMDTLNAEFGLLRDQIVDIGIGVGQTLAPAIRDVLGVARSALSTFAEWNSSLDDLPATIGLLVSVVGGLALAVGAFVSGPLGVAIAAAGAFAAAYRTNFLGVADVVNALVSRARSAFERFMPSMDELRAAADTLREAFDVWRAEVEENLETLRPHFETFAEQGERVFGIVGENLDALRSLAETAFGALTDESDDVSGSFGSLAERMRSVLDTVLGVLTTLTAVYVDAFEFISENVFQPFLEIVGDVWETHLGAIVSETAETVEVLLADLQRLAAFGMRIIRPFLRAAAFLWDRFGDEILTVTEFVFDAIGGIISTVLDAAATTIRVTLALIRGDWRAAWTLVGAFLRRTLSGLFEFVESWGERLVGYIAGVLGDVSGWFDDVMDDIGEFFRGGFGDLLTFVTDWVDDVIAALGGMAERVGDEIRTAINEAMGLPFEHTIGAVSVGGEEVFAGHEINIPALADGGVVNGATLAMIGEAGPEAVVPLDRSDEFGGAASGDVAAQVSSALSGLRVVVETGDETLDRVIHDEAQVVVEQSNRDQRRRSRSRGLGQ